MEMGHTDEIVFADSNFPAASHARRLIRADGIGITDLLDAVLPLFPIDYATDHSALLMAKNGEGEPRVWAAYKEKLASYSNGGKPLAELPKPEFYERARNAYCIVATGETETFANLIIRKGVIK